MKIYIAPEEAPVAAPKTAVSKPRKLSPFVKVAGLLAAVLVLTLGFPVSSSAGFTFNWLGTPSSPQAFRSDGTWDVSVHKRASGSASDPSAAATTPTVRRRFRSPRCEPSLPADSYLARLAAPLGPDQV